jgi:hypothetical protein
MYYTTIFLEWYQYQYSTCIVWYILA